MTNEALLEGLISELKRGTIVLAALSQLKSPQYGYSLVQTLNEKGLDVEANTLYPLLRRLESQHLLTSEWETGGSKPRKYYVLTEYGGEIYEKLKVNWKDAVKSMAALTEE